MLDSIQSPDQLSSLCIEELEQLAAEIRQRIVEILSKTGGHLASNLGSVELTLALHFVFDSPIDQFIFDVSHQTYTHKMLTGRLGQFQRLRQYKGLCGFSYPPESPHDLFHAGHAGTALSLGLGCATSRDLNGEEHHVIPVIGDATLSCGLSLEALNNIPSDLKRFLVILNDNAMSISQNVGGISSILQEVSCQRLGSASFFEQFGLSYVGPIDGHDLRKLIPLLEAVKHSEKPLLLHLLTQKGQGISPAEKDPITYHGVKPFNPTTYKFIPHPAPSPTFPKVLGRELVKMGEEDEDLVVITPAMSVGSSLIDFFQKFPHRGFDVGIAEGHAVTFAGGIAKGGKRVICSIYSTFLQRALDNLFHDVALQELPVVFTIDRGGLSGPDGSTHHGIFEIGFLRMMPEMVICQPRDGQLLAELLNESFSWRRPTAIRFPNQSTNGPSLPSKKRPLGQGEKLADGKDLAILALGHMTKSAMQVRSLLLEMGIEASVLDPIFVKPLDQELLRNELKSHRRLVTLEEHSLKGGLAAEVREQLSGFSFDHLALGIPDTFVPHGGYGDLIEELGLSPKRIVQSIEHHFSFKRQPLEVG